MIDTHSHIYLDTFDNDREKVIDSALANGVTKILLPNIDTDSITSMLLTELEFPDICKSMIGIHPSSIKNDYIDALSIIEKELEKNKYIAIGEIGIDLYWDTSFEKEQKEALIKQLEWAKEKNMPAVIHTRNAFPEIFKIFEKVYDKRLKGVFHSFSGNLEDAKRILEMPDFFLGTNGTVTYKNSKLPDILLKTGYAKILLETDAPYLPPTPYRGKRNEPAYLIKTAEKTAEIFSLSIEEIDSITTINAQKLFNI
jgi:TatD DNase family protein